MIDRDKSRSMNMRREASEVSYSDAVAGSSLPLKLKFFRLVGRQTWIPRGQDRLLRSIWPRAGRSFRFEVDFFGRRYRGDLSEYLDWAVFAYGAYAMRELTLLAALAKRIRSEKGSFTFYDVGANLGHHTLFMSLYADEVVAFEPFPHLQEAIREKISLNRLTNVRLVPYALGLNDATLDYFPGSSGNSGSGTLIPESFESYEPPVKVEIRAGDQLHNELNLPPIDLLKIDVEGFESQVFQGLRKRILLDRPPIVMEMGARCRNGFGSEKAFRESFYPDAVFAEISGRNGRPYALKRFHYESSGEALVAPPEFEGWVTSQMSS
jgi:FkbM family methyltransferase